MGWVFNPLSVKIIALLHFSVPFIVTCLVVTCADACGIKLYSQGGCVRIIPPAVCLDQWYGTLGTAQIRYKKAPKKRLRFHWNRTKKKHSKIGGTETLWEELDVQVELVFFNWKVFHLSWVLECSFELRFTIFYFIKFSFYILNCC